MTARQPGWQHVRNDCTNPVNNTRSHISVHPTLWRYFRARARSRDARAPCLQCPKRCVYVYPPGNFEGLFQSTYFMNLPRLREHSLVTRASVLDARGRGARIWGVKEPPIAPGRILVVSFLGAWQRLPGTPTSPFFLVLGVTFFSHTDSGLTAIKPPGSRLSGVAFPRYSFNSLRSGAELKGDRHKPPAGSAAVRSAQLTLSRPLIASVSRPILVTITVREYFPIIALF